MGGSRNRGRPRRAYQSKLIDTQPTKIDQITDSSMAEDHLPSKLSFINIL